MDKKLEVPKVSFKILRRVLVLVILISVSFSSGYFFGYKGYLFEMKTFPKVNIVRQTPPDKSTLDFSLFWKVWDTLNSKYYDKSKLVPAQMVYGAIKGMVASIGDPYTVFLAPTENKVVNEDLSGSFSGVGIEIGFKGTQLAVMAPLAGSPADKAGIKAGDLIVGIKDKDKNIDRGTVGISLPEAVEEIRGQEGSTVTLTIIREGAKDPIVVDLVRKSINVPSVTLTWVGKDKSIADVQVTKFAQETPNEWNNAMVEILKNQKFSGMVVDLRNNPGGYLQGAVELASDFVNKGDVVVIEQDADGSKQNFTSQRIGRFLNSKVIVIVNGGSASASEIFSGALRDDRKIKLLGETSFGKGTIQEPEDLSNGAGIHITIAKWLTPSGFWVNGKGLTPDISVKDDPNTPADEQMDAAVAAIQGK